MVARPMSVDIVPLGGDFDAALMSRIADRGAGGYYYLADSSQIGAALTAEIDARLQPVATAVELRIRLRPEIAVTHVFGSHELSAPEAAAVRAQEVTLDQHAARAGVAPDRQTDSVGGIRFFIPAFARGDRHTTMITVELPAAAGQRSLGSIEVRYKDRLLKKNVTRELPITLREAASNAESASTEDPTIEPMVQAFEAGETLLAAAEDINQGDRAAARRTLDERAEVLRRAAEVLNEPRLAEDGARLARWAGLVIGDALRDPLPLVVMLRGSGYGYL
jgi:Ca-activated chloride channel family protein